MSKETPINIIQIIPTVESIQGHAPACSIDKKGSKEHTLGTRFEEIIEARQTLDMANGRTPTKINAEYGMLREKFYSSSIDQRKSALESLSLDFSSRLQSSFMANLCLYDELQTKTNGIENNETQNEFTARKDKFDHSKLPTKLVLALQMKEDAENLLLQKYDSLLIAWGNTLKEMKAPDTEIKASIEEWENKFLNADLKVAQVGIAKSLKDKIDTATRASFSPMLDLYSRLRTENNITENTFDFPNEKAYLERHDNASYSGKHQLIQSIEDRIHKLMSLAKSKTQNGEPISLATKTDDKVGTPIFIEGQNLVDKSGDSALLNN